MTARCRTCGYRECEHDPIDGQCPDDADHARQNALEVGEEPEPEFTDCGRGREAMISGCGCDACSWAGDQEYHRRKDDGW